MMDLEVLAAGSLQQMVPANSVPMDPHVFSGARVNILKSWLIGQIVNPRPRILLT